MDETKIQRLARLGVLRASGALTDDEFKAQKALVLGSGGRDADVSSGDAKLGRIEALRQSGALTDAEAAVEKAKILRPVEISISERREEAATVFAESGPLVPTWAAKPKKTSQSSVFLIASILVLVVVSASGAWWWFKKESALAGEGDVYEITSLANARTAPTTEFSSVVDTLSAGDRVRGRLVAGRNGSRWLETSGEPKTYIWEGNLRLN
ncbi:SHOCT domain-containing protein [Brevundimonas vesicularis]|uniref:SHOCT domain-containing protein n=1 Tax=Brevundimonas vesicularis TaxID=41276 RepID=A0ABU4KUP2_BREVE|nr:SHOCT domain-containing protein [Brevundimonas vesicularis]MDX2336509.1 SHOCT domain-containing protein [Brevundimonas vesicularis]